MKRVGRAAGNSGQHPVSPAHPNAGNARAPQEAGSTPARVRAGGRERGRAQRLDRPAAYTQHGYVAYSRYGCRCDICREGRRNYVRAWRAKSYPKPAKPKPLKRLPEPFGEFYAAVFGGGKRKCVTTGGSRKR